MANYVDDSNGYDATAYSDSRLATLSDGTTPTAYSWYEVLYYNKYYGSGVDNFTSISKTFDLLRCPGIKISSKFETESAWRLNRVAYGYPLLANNTFSYNVPFTSKGYPGYVIKKIKRPSSFLRLGCSLYAGDSIGIQRQSSLMYVHPNYMGSCSWPSYRHAFAQNAHNSGNTLMVDGHVRSWTVGDILTHNSNVTDEAIEKGDIFGGICYYIGKF
jgi:prepilin-type processing-associated H-X9-DG protein